MILEALVRRTLPVLPRGVLWLFARRYVAGSDLQDALARVRGLRADGFGTILDVLGEDVESASRAEDAAREYERALDALPAVDPACTVSVKPTHLGLRIDPDLCERLLDRLCRRAADDRRRVRLEMEAAPTVDDTLDVFRRVRGRHANLGCVIQSRLFRSEADVDRLLAEVRPLDVRLVKGIYVEPADIAWTEDADIVESYVRLAGKLASAGAHVALATHDGVLAERCLPLVRGGSYEIQCLMGVRRAFAQQLRDAGHEVRVYVPYGRDWHAYSLRRMQKNPAILRHVLRAAFGRDR